MWIEPATFYAWVFDLFFWFVAVYFIGKCRGFKDCSKIWDPMMGRVLREHKEAVGLLSYLRRHPAFTAIVEEVEKNQKG